MWFFVERAVDESLRDWEEIGVTEVTGIRRFAEGELSLEQYRERRSVLEEKR